MIWTPGYWAYGPDGYYWVPGAWVPAPYAGALWTPGYWGWSGGLYVWHSGYWARHVGYYGGVNYGGGYFGIGFAGGEWRGGVFAYNTAVVRVDPRFVHTTFVDRTVINRYTVENPRHVAYAGGPGGINHAPTAEERMAEHDQHMGRTSFQTEHVNAAMHDRSSYFNNNHGHPSTFAESKPLGAETHGAPAGTGHPGGNGAANTYRPNNGAGHTTGSHNSNAGGSRPTGQPHNTSHGHPQGRPGGGPKPEPHRNQRGHR